MLAAAVHACKGLFMQQADKTVPGSQMPHDIHGQHIVIAGIIGIFINRGDLELPRRHLIVACLGGNAQGHKLIFHILHETHYPGGNGAKIVIFHFLPLGRGRANQRASRKKNIGPQGGKIAVHQKIFLFRANHCAHICNLVIAKNAQDALRLAGKRRQGAH